MSYKRIATCGLLVCLLAAAALRAGADDLVVTCRGVTVLNGQTVDLGTWVRDSSTTYTFTARNSGTGTLTMTSLGDHVSVSGSGLTLLTDLPLTLPAGASRNFVVNFDSTGITDGTVVTGSISIPYDDVGEGHYSLAFSIRITVTDGAVPEINLRLPSNGSIPSGTVDAIDFGDQLVNTPSAPRTVEIESIGSGELRLTGTPRVSISGAGFAQAGADPVTPVVQSTPSSLAIRFTPTSAGAKSATVSIADNDSDENPYTFTIKGTGVAPEMNVKVNGTDVTDGGNYPLSGSTLVGDFTPITVTLENGASGELRLTGTPRVSVAGAGFAQSGADPVTPIIQGTPSSFIIRFTPTSAGPKSATVSIDNNDLDENPYNFTINATAVVPDMNVKVNGTDVTDGGNYPLGGSTLVGDSTNITVTIENGASGELRLTGAPRVSVAGAGFAQSGADPVTPIIQGTPSTVTIRFTPTSAGPKSATVSIANNDSDENPYNFTINATAVVPEMNVKVNGTDVTDGGNYPLSGSTLVGDFTPITVTIENGASGELRLTGAPRVSVAGAGFAQSGADPVTPIIQGTPSTVTIRFTPTSAGPKSATVSIANNDSDENPYNFTINATAVPEQIVFPRVAPVPSTSPTVDGVVNGDPGWNGSARITFDNGVGRTPVAFQAVKSRDGASLYFSCEVTDDLAFNGDDIVVIGIRPDRNSPAGGANDIRFVLFPVGAGTVTGAGQDPAAKHLYRNSSAWAEVASWPTDPNLLLKVGADPAAHTWNLEMQLPVALQISPTETLAIADQMLFYMNIVRDYGTTASEFTWPLHAPKVSGIFDDYPFSTAEWGFADKSDTAIGSGVWIQMSDISSANTPDSYIDPTAGFVNTLRATAHNDMKSGETPVAAPRVTALYRLANWGIPGATEWTPVPSGEPGINPVSVALIDPASSHTFELQWGVSDALRPQYQAHPHQCMMVELDSTSDTTKVVFSRKSATRNMDFVRASVFTRDAVIGTGGYGPAPAWKAAHEFVLRVTTVESAREVESKIPGLAGKSTRLTWICEGYRATGQFLTVHGNRYELYDPVGSFGYIAAHEGPVARWDWELRGAQKVDGNTYRLSIAPGQSATVTTRITAREYTWLSSAHVGTAIPIAGFAAGTTAGFRAIIDFGIPVCSWLMLEAIGGYSAFPTGVPGASVTWLDLSAELKALVPFKGRISAYVEAGAGGYLPWGGAVQAGLNAGAGFEYAVNSSLSVEAGGEYHLLPFSGMQFAGAHAGMIARF